MDKAKKITIIKRISSGTKNQQVSSNEDFLSRGKPGGGSEGNAPPAEAAKAKKAAKKAATKTGEVEESGD